MKFPLQHCIYTRPLGKDTIGDLITAMQKDGYHLVYHDNPKDWDYLGVNEYGDIMMFSDSASYISIGTKKGMDNIVSKVWMRDYLEAHV